MSKVRSLLVERAAKAAYDHWRSQLPDTLFCPRWEDVGRERANWLDEAEAAVAAVLDAMSEGPLHEQMVRLAAARLARSVGLSRTTYHALATAVLSAALGAARMEEE